MIWLEIGPDSILTMAPLVFVTESTIPSFVRDYVTTALIYLGQDIYVTHLSIFLHLAQWYKVVI